MQYHAHQRNPDRDVALSCDLLTDVHPVKWLLASPTERELSDDQRHCLLFPIPIAHIAAMRLQGSCIPVSAGHPQP